MVSDKDPKEPRKNYTQIEIEITDINDNQPVFSQNSWSIKVEENIAINSKLLKVRQHIFGNYHLSCIQFFAK